MRFLIPEITERIMYAYCHGVSVEDICDLLGGNDIDEVNGVIDAYADLFLEG